MNDCGIDQHLCPMPSWAIKQIVRESGLIENVCIHNIGHPHPNSVKYLADMGMTGFEIHSCDGCCCKEVPPDDD